MDEWFTHVQEAYAKHPCVQSTRLQGLAVGHIEPYGCTRIRARGPPHANVGEFFIQCSIYIRLWNIPIPAQRTLDWWSLWWI